MRCDLSVIVPLYYEEDNVRLLHEAICAAIRPLGLRTEIVFVDDGSKDRTFERCLELQRTDPTLRWSSSGATPARRRRWRPASIMPVATC